MTRAVATRYARSLWASGFPALTIGRAVRMDAGTVASLAEREGWRRTTPCRGDAVLLHRYPVTVRCGSCFALYGDEAGRDRRACPRCGGEQLELQGVA